MPFPLRGDVAAPTPAGPPPLLVHVLLFDDVEVLDFAGPFEVFATAGRERGTPPFRVRTVARSGLPVVARHGLTLLPDTTFEAEGRPDVLVIPGGAGTRRLMTDPTTLAWLAAAAPATQVTLSVCTGALLLGAAGLLHGLWATTHHTTFAELREVAPETRVMEHARVVDNGRIVTSAGVSAGIDGALHVVDRLLGRACADDTARDIGYDWRPARGLVA
jgi:transcriptional regulator GlxA family with amidase domain